MDDGIVTRLRHAAVGLPQDDMNQTAADEIERLRAERDELLASGNQLHAWITVHATCASLAATPGATILYAIHHAYHPVPEDVADLLAAWEEARRG